MSRKFPVVISCFAVVLSLWAWQSPAAPVPPQAQRVVPKWEYKVLTWNEVLGLGRGEKKLDPTDDRNRIFADGMNALGADGWEFVALNPAERPAIYHFKRPK